MFENKEEIGKKRHANKRVKLFACFGQALWIKYDFLQFKYGLVISSIYSKSC